MQKETEADFRFSVLIVGEQIKICPRDLCSIFLLFYLEIKTESVPVISDLFWDYPQW